MKDEFIDFVMKFLFLDDAKQKSPSRERMGTLVGVGGLIVDADAVAHLEKSLDDLCKRKGFPTGQMFKWSPSRSDWLRSNLEGEDRERFFAQVLKLCVDAGASGVVAMCDVSKKQANPKASDHEIDALLLALERFHTSLAGDTGIVLISKPSGGTKSENKMLSECIEHRVMGTDFVAFDRIALNPVVMPAANSRLLQAADLFVSISTAMGAGNTSHADLLFKNHIEPILLKDWRGLVGNTGFKLHPNLLYRNVYHWVLGEISRAEGSIGYPLPDLAKPYATDPLKY